MLKLRPYKPCDAETIVTWCRDEQTFFRWTAGRYETYPVTAEDMNRKYIENNGDCPEPDNFYPMTAYDETGVAGHLILRFLDLEKTMVRLGFVIVDDSRRGLGYGKEMIRLALNFAFEFLKAEKVTIEVFENNLPAYQCYRAAGFQETESETERFVTMGENRWKLLELAIEREGSAQEGK